MAQLKLKVESQDEDALRAIAEIVEKMVVNIAVAGELKLLEAAMLKNNGNLLDFGMVARK